MTLLPTRLDRAFNLVLARSIKLGAQFGLAQSPLIPESLKRRVGKKHQKLNPSAGAITHAWESKVLDDFWFGRTNEAFDALVHALKAEKISFFRLDFIVRFLWHSVTNGVWKVTPAAQHIWEEALQRHNWEGKPPHRYQVGQWLAAQLRSNQPSLNWNPSAETTHFAELSNNQELHIDCDNVDLSAAAIRFELPENWLAFACPLAGIELG